MFISLLFLALRRGIGETHRRYSRMINFRENWRGHLWPGRFASFPMNESYLLAAALSVEMKPVRANLDPYPVLWPWGSAQAHLTGKDDGLVKAGPLLEMVGGWKLFLAGADEERLNDIRRHERTGRPLGSNVFVERLESDLGRLLKQQKPGPKGKRN